MNKIACAECGARVEVGSEHCDLCGWPVQDSDPPETPPESGTSEKGSFCNDCGWQNPPRARFCSQCGARLQELIPQSIPAAKVVRVTPTPSVSRRKVSVVPGVGRQVAIVFGLSILLLLALFMVTAVSKRTHSTDSAVATTSESSPALVLTPPSGELDEQIAILDDAIASDTGATALALEREKVFMLVQAARVDLAAEAQQTIALRTGDVEDWRAAGNLYYDWMADVEDPVERGQIAELAITAYQEVLTRNPDNHDVRTDMATAYLNTGNPMQGVTEIKRVLEVAPNHLNATFNYGLMLARINRTDKALEQLARVLILSPDTTSTHYRRARALIASIQVQLDS